MRTQFVVPTNAQAIDAWASDFKERYGVPPIAGGETPTATPTPPAPPAAAPQPAPATAATPPPAAAPAAVPPGQPAAPAAPADPAAAAPAAEPMPGFAKTLLERMDELAPPAQVDPLAVELGFAPPPPQPLPGQPGFDPSQAGAAAGQSQPGVPRPPQPAALPGQGPAPMPGTPGMGAQPGQSPDEFVEQLIDGRAGQVAERLFQERVAPLFQQQAAVTRRTEGAALLEDYPELQEPGKQAALLAQAQAWGQEVLGTRDVAREPGFLEVVHLAMKGLEGAKGQQPAAPGGGEVPIEGGGAASPTPVATQPEQIAQAIVDAKSGGGLDPLWL